MDKCEKEKLENFMSLSAKIVCRIEKELRETGRTIVHRGEITSSIVKDALNEVNKVPLFTLSDNSYDFKEFGGIRFIIAENGELYFSDYRVRHIIISYLTGKPYLYRLIHDFSTDILTYSDNLADVAAIKSELRNIDSILSVATVKILKIFPKIKRGMCVTGEVDISTHLSVAN